jgi:hypothetical protein
MYDVAVAFGGNKRERDQDQQVWKLRTLELWKTRQQFNRSLMLGDRMMISSELLIGETDGNKISC